MNRFNTVRDGAICRLPLGFRFQPTDEELVFHYLKHKVISCPSPASIIPENNVCNCDYPWDMPAVYPEQDRYFFSYKETKQGNGYRVNRTTSSGYWKVSGSDKRISSLKRSNEFWGLRKTLVFYEGKSPRGSRTHWIMREYRLVSSGITGRENQVGNWVLCRVFSKERRKYSVNSNINIHIQKQNMVEIVEPRFFDFMMVGTNPVLSTASASSSSFSCVTKFTSSQRTKKQGDTCDLCLPLAL